AAISSANNGQNTRSEKTVGQTNLMNVIKIFPSSNCGSGCDCDPLRSFRAYQYRNQPDQRSSSTRQSIVWLTLHWSALQLQFKGQARLKIGIKRVNYIAKIIATIKQTKPKVCPTKRTKRSWNGVQLKLDDSMVAKWKFPQCFPWIMPLERLNKNPQSQSVFIDASSWPAFAFHHTLFTQQLLQKKPSCCLLTHLHIYFCTILELPQNKSLKKIL
ncbi:Hypothetical predicted protein, partial [Drosophila guanche]